MQDPRIGNIQPPPPSGPEPGPPDRNPPGFRRPYIGQPIHFWPHRGHHPESHFGPHAAIVLWIHPGDPRIVHLYYFGPKGEVGSYADIPHRSLRPDCEPPSAWQGRAMPPSTHWTHAEGEP